MDLDLEYGLRESQYSVVAGSGDEGDDEDWDMRSVGSQIQNLGRGPGRDDQLEGSIHEDADLDSDLENMSGLSRSDSDSGAEGVYEQFNYLTNSLTTQIHPEPFSLN
jgi:hypothetical protein